MSTTDRKYITLKDAGNRRWINCASNMSLCDDYGYEACRPEIDSNNITVHVCQNGYRRKLNGCISSLYCFESDFCDYDSGQCFPPVEQGDPCSPNATLSCLPDLYCHPQLLRCVKASQLVTYPACTNDAGCPVSEFCASGQCTARLALDEPCTLGGAKCALGLSCYKDTRTNQGTKCRKLCHNNQDCAPKGHCFDAEIGMAVGVCMGSAAPSYRGSEPSNLWTKPWFIVILIIAMFVFVCLAVFCIWRFRRRQQQNERLLRDKLSHTSALYYVAPNTAVTADQENSQTLS